MCVRLCEQNSYNRLENAIDKFWYFHKFYPVEAEQKCLDSNTFTHARIRETERESRKKSRKEQKESIKSSLYIELFIILQKYIYIDTISLMSAFESPFG